MIRTSEHIKPQDFEEYDAVLIVGTISKSALQQFKINHNIVLVDGGGNNDDNVDVVDTN